MQPPPGRVVDHINGNGYDNTRANLRNISREENMHNMRKHAGTASLYKGVAPGKRAGTWYARIGWGDTHSQAGPFEEEVEAARAYDRMAVERFGESARVNFPRDWPPQQRAQVYAEARAKREALLAQAAQAKKRKGRRKRDKSEGTKRRPVISRRDAGTQRKKADRGPRTDSRLPVSHRGDMEDTEKTPEPKNHEGCEGHEGEQNRRGRRGCRPSGRKQNGRSRRPAKTPKRRKGRGRQ